MKKIILSVLILGSICILAACSINFSKIEGTAQQQSPSPITSATSLPSSVTETDNPTLPIFPTASSTVVITSTIEAPATPTMTPEPTQPTLYKLDVLYDVEEKQLRVIEAIDYLNLTQMTLEEITLVVPPTLLGSNFILNSLSIGDEAAQPEYVFQGERLSIKLPNSLEPMETFPIKLEYIINLPNSGGVLGYTDRQTNVSDWYAFVPPYQGESGWMVNPYSAVGEYLVYDVADFEVKISLARASSSMVIAASTPGEIIGNNWFFELSGARTFAWSASTEYQVLRQAENSTVIAYVLPEHVDAGWRALAASISALNLYSGLFEAYPHQTLSLVEGDFFDGMEYDGLFFLGAHYFENYKDGEDNFLTLISAHETAHQWWFAGVGNDAANEPWLDEALATYSELFFYELYYPGDEEWWWDFRVDSYSPSGRVNGKVYDFSESRVYENAVYLNGARFLDEIRNTIGDEAFKAFLQEYYQVGKGKIMTRQGFFDILGRHANMDISAIVNKYFRE